MNTNLKWRHSDVLEKSPIRLRGLTWDDPRGYGPFSDVGEAFAKSYEGKLVSVRWDVQPLSGFETRPIADIAAHYDLVVMDHPHTLEAVRQGCLTPIANLEDSYVGKTHRSYQLEGRQWAAPIDAACHLSAYAPGNAIASLRDWGEVFSAAENGVRIAAPLAGVHSFMALLTLIASQAIDLNEDFNIENCVAETGGDASVEIALGILRRLCEVSVVTEDGESGLDWNPIDALAALAGGQCDYLPLTFGYAHFCDQGIQFANVPAVKAGVAPRGILGGAGVAVSASSEHWCEAVEFAKFASGSYAQVEYWHRPGGQPAHEEAWNQLAREHSYYRETRSAMERAFIRPRAANWNAIQTRAGAVIEQWLRVGEPSCRNVLGALREVLSPLSA